MSVPKKRNRLFAGLMMSLMCVLSLYTVVFAKGWEAEGSYTLVIEKKFSAGENLPPEVLEQAKELTYTFKIQGTRKDDNGNEFEVDDEITLPRKGVTGEEAWKSETFHSSGPFNVTVTEITDNITINVDSKYYNMSDSTSNTTTTIDSRIHTLELRNNSRLTIKRPNDPGDSDDPNYEAPPKKLSYRITSKQEAGHTGTFTPLDQTIELEAGQTVTLGDDESQYGITHLDAGIYTIEQVAAPDGYTVLVGPRTETVKPGEKGSFYINGNPGQLSLTPLGDKDDHRKHRYTVDLVKPAEDEEVKFKPRPVEIEPGETAIVGDLPKGEYTVTEETIPTDESFTLKATQERAISSKSTALTTGETPRWLVQDIGDANFYVDHIKFLGFGPLYKTSGKNDITLDSSYTYNIFRCGLAEYNSEKNNYSIYNISGYKKTNFLGNKSYTITEPPVLEAPEGQKIAFTVIGVSSSVAKKIGVKWYEYGVKTMEYPNAGIYHSFDVDARREVEIKAPKLPNPDAEGADKIRYYYTITDADYYLIAGITDDENVPLPETKDSDGNPRTVCLKPGESVKIILPEKGSYHILETIEGNTGPGFEMTVAGHEFHTTDASKKFNITIFGSRTFTISKSIPEGDTREYPFTISGPGFDETNNKIKLDEKTGSVTTQFESKGTYIITPQQKTLDTYELSYTDSGAVYGTASESQAEVVFTNTFSEGDYAYRYIHEYYIKEADGTYTPDGTSLITTVRGKNLSETYYANNISKESSYKGLQYTHFDESYGWVTPLDPEISSVIPDTDHRDPNSQPPFTSKYNGVLINGGTATANTGNPSRPTREVQYAPVSGWDRVKVTTDAREIVILRYYRERNPSGKYKVIHEYYRRTPTGGDIWEGQTKVETRDGELDVPYTAEDDVTLKPKFQPEGDLEYTYTWDERARYGITVDPQKDENGEYVIDTYTGQKKIYQVDTDWTSVKGTMNGDEIIILRYYRTPSLEGSYRIVHEYYYREKRGDSGSAEEEGGSEDGNESAPEGQSLEEDPSDGGFLEEMEPSEDEEPAEPFDAQSYEALFDPSPSITTQPVPDEDAAPPVKANDPLALDNPAPILEENGDSLFGPDELPDPESIDAQPVFDEMSEELPGLEASAPPMQLETGDASAGSNGSGEPGEALAPTGGEEATDANEVEEPPTDGVELPPIENNALLAPAAAEEALTSDEEEEPSTEPGENGQPQDPGETGEDFIEPYADDESGDESSEESSSFAGTLAADGEFVYTYEGRQGMETYVETLGTTREGTKDDFLLQFTPEGDEEHTYENYDIAYGTSVIMADGHCGEYSYNPDMKWASAKESGEDIIIIRYFRSDDEPDTPPEEPDNPPEEPDEPPRKPKDPDDPPKEPEDPPKEPETPPEEPETPPEEPETPPETPETPPEEPETPPETPEYPTEPPDPNDPNSPEEITIIGPNGVPLTYIKFWDPEKEEWVYLPEDEIPLAPMDGTPQTGDEAQPVLWGVLCAASLGAVWAMLPRNRKKRSIRRNRQR